jgi:hypothetical protein
MTERWVLLVYRLPREPSTPRIAVWRKLRRLGVAQLADGLVALPLDARNRERLEWVAEEVVEAGGTAGVWLAEPESRRLEQTLVADLRAARAVEYARVVAEANQAAGAESEVARRRAARRLRRKLRDIRRRDYFPPDERQQARAAVERLAAIDEVRYLQPVVSGEDPPQDADPDNDPIVARGHISSDPYHNIGLTSPWLGLLDTGVRRTHSMFNGPRRIDWCMDCVNGGLNCNNTGAANFDCTDIWPHGTSSAGILSGYVVGTKATRPGDGA